jgi:hypothetical protein
VSRVTPGRRFERALWTATILIALIGVAFALRRTRFVLSILLGGYHPPAAVANPLAAQAAALDDGFARHPLLTLVHVLPGLLFMLLGPLQFSRRIRERHLAWHRRIGGVFLVNGAVIGVTALLAKAYVHIRRRRIALHREWMIRAFSIGLAVATIRPIIGIFFATSPLTGLTPREFFGTAFWIGWTLHLIAAETWINVTRPQASYDGLVR